MFANHKASHALESALPATATKEDRTIVMLTVAGLALVGLAVAITMTADIGIYEYVVSYEPEYVTDWTGIRTTPPDAVDIVREIMVYPGQY